MTTDFDRDEVIAQVTNKLAEKYSKVARTRVEEVVREEVDALTGRPVQDYVSVLGERAAKKRLKDEVGDRRS